MGAGKQAGSFLIELVLWLAACVPGLIYSLWRLTTAKRCGSCQGELVPLESPRGRHLWQTYHHNQLPPPR
jgi:hypothetical protein